MAHFYAVAVGQAKTSATRQGSKKSGLVTVAASWQGAVNVQLYEKDGVDYARVSLRPWHGRGRDLDLYHGPVGEVEAA